MIASIRDAAAGGEIHGAANAWSLKDEDIARLYDRAHRELSTEVGELLDRWPATRDAYRGAELVRRLLRRRRPEPRNV